MKIILNVDMKGGRVMVEDLHSVAWSGGGLRLIDQTRLPDRLVYLDVRTVDDLVDAIRRLAVRGAPALGAAGVYGVALALAQGEREGWSPAEVDAAVVAVRTARPTAVNLAWGVDRVLPYVSKGIDAVLDEAAAVVAEDEAGNRAMGRHGADWIAAHTARSRLRILTHCNTGALATAGWGTALGVVRELQARGAVGLVYVDETRPLLQGARLTSWELLHDGIPHVVQADGAAAGAILRGEVDVAIIGADRIAANGDTANKIGSVGIALACADAGIPFVVAAPSTTRDPATAAGEDIRIELRPEEEVLAVGGVRVAPAGARGHNPAFDVTPARLISAIVTESGVDEPRAG